MPNTVIHEEVGYYLSSKLNKNSYEFYLGLMAPDAVNYEKFATKNERWTSHLRCENLNSWKLSLKKFYLENKTKYNEDFLLGYVIHILTDIVYDEYFEEEIKKEILKENDEKNYWYIKWSDMDKYSFKDKKKIINILNQEDKYYEITNITEDKLRKWKIKFTKDLEKENKSIYFNQKIIDNLNIRVEEELKILKG